MTATVSDKKEKQEVCPTRALPIGHLIAFNHTTLCWARLSTRCKANTVKAQLIARKDLSIQLLFPPYGFSRFLFVATTRVSKTEELETARKTPGRRGDE